jgi:formate/nitrite transporter FocA (FNT family)
MAIMPTLSALEDWAWEFAAWVTVGLLIGGAAFYAVTHR